MERQNVFTFSEFIIGRFLCLCRRKYSKTALFFILFFPGDYYLLTAPAEAVHASMCPIIWFIKFFQQTMITPQPKQIIIFRCLCVSTRVWTQGYKCMNGGFQVASYPLFPTYTLKQGLTLNLELFSSQAASLRIPCVSASGMTGKPQSPPDSNHGDWRSKLLS